MRLISRRIHTKVHCKRCQPIVTAKQREQRKAIVIPANIAGWDFTRITARVYVHITFFTFRNFRNIASIERKTVMETQLWWLSHKLLAKCVSSSTKSPSRSILRETLSSLDRRGRKSPNYSSLLEFFPTELHKGHKRDTCLRLLHPVVFWKCPQLKH